MPKQENAMMKRIKIWMLNRKVNAAKANLASVLAMPADYLAKQTIDVVPLLRIYIKQHEADLLKLTDAAAAVLPATL
jgi:hypothetical protein